VLRDNARLQVKVVVVFLTLLLHRHSEVRWCLEAAGLKTLFACVASTSFCYLLDLLHAYQTTMDCSVLASAPLKAPYGALSVLYKPPSILGKRRLSSINQASDWEAQRAPNPPALVFGNNTSFSSRLNLATTEDLSHLSCDDAYEPSDSSSEVSSDDESYVNPSELIGGSSTLMSFDLSMTEKRGKRAGKHHCDWDGCLKVYSKASRLTEHQRSHTGEVREMIACFLTPYVPVNSAV